VGLSQLMKRINVKMYKRAIPNPASNLSGFTLFEILLAVLFLAIAVAPLVSAFQPAIFATTNEEELSVFSNRCRGTLNRVAALDFTLLDSNKGGAVSLEVLFGSSEEAAKEAFSFNNNSYVPTVTVTTSDQDAHNKGGLLEIAATIGSVTVKTLRAQY
jgi:Tfp pilus assembly protein PilV